MRTDEALGQTVSNGYAVTTNGNTPRKPSHSTMNGHSSPHTNGSSPVANGKRQALTQDPTYRGHDRVEVTRILIQGLLDMGYQDAARTLSRESGYELESPPVAAFRSAILNGDWIDAENILLGSYPQDVDSYYRSNGHDFDSGLVLAEGADRGQMLFWIRQQKFLELLDSRDLGMALMVLRQELTPLHPDTHQLHALSRLLMCPPEELRTQAYWPETIEESRKALLHDLSCSIAPSVMIRDHRLAELFDQVKYAQINQCLYHNTSVAPSLYSDHMCNRNDFPLRTWIQLDDHQGEVWHVQFSPDGTKLATASQDRTVYVYDTTTFKVLHKLDDHLKEVVFVAWSPDSSKLITCCQDCKARVWDIATGRVLVSVEHRTVDHNYGITSASWAPDSVSFVTASHDRESQLCHWDTRSLKPLEPVHTWQPGFRAHDCAITADGKRVIVLATHNCLYIYDLKTHRQEAMIELQPEGKATAMTVSEDGVMALINFSVGEVHMIDLDTKTTVRVFKGQKQGEFVIRNCFGGAAENFVLSGSEDGQIYVWHKENAALIETLEGHGKGQGGKQCVTSVCWNPKDAGMFASGGDDRKVRIWTNTASPGDVIPLSADRQSPRHDAGRTSAMRSTL